MRRRALLIGSQTGGLTGVHADVEAMSEVLRRLQFSTDDFTDEQASYQGITGAYREFIEDTKDGDAVVVYYSGHGGRVPNPRAKQDSSQPAWMHFIVSTDCWPRS
jgi:uncharacterized caspase-like protein